MKAALLALQFLTVITVKSGLQAGPGDLARSRSWYGAVGLVLGGLLALAAWLLAPLLPQPALAGVLVFVWAASTRFLHLDGVADTADALVNYTAKQRTLEIMKDTSLGSFGAAAIACLLVLKFSILAVFSAGGLWRALLIACPLGRALAAGLSVLLSPARSDQGLAAAAGDSQSLTPLFASGGVAAAAAWVVGGGPGLWACVAVLALGVVLGQWFQRRIGGVTGDCLGAAVELGEAAALLALALAF